MQDNENNITKICFKCHRELPLTMFYKHPQMADGHLNKCKDCTKQDVHNKYMDNIENPDYVEKERERGREKYRRLGYKDIYKSTHKEASNVCRNLKNKLNIPPEYEIHHWNYNFLYDVFILSRRYHARIHKQITFDKDTKCFYYNGSLLDTKQKHEQAIRMILQLNQDEKIVQFVKD